MSRFVQRLDAHSAGETLGFTPCPCFGRTIEGGTETRIRSKLSTGTGPRNVGRSTRNSRWRTRNSDCRIVRSCASAALTISVRGENDVAVSRFPSLAQRALALRPHAFRRLHPAPKALGHEKSFFANALAREAHENGESPRKALLAGVWSDFVFSSRAGTRS